MKQKHEAITIIRDDAYSFRTRDKTSEVVCEIYIRTWMNLPAPCPTKNFKITAFGGINMAETIITSSLADGIVQMGHLRSLYPETFAPCCNPYTEYTDNEDILLPTMKTTQGEIYKMPLNLLKMVQHIVSGYIYLSNETNADKTEFSHWSVV